MECNRGYDNFEQVQGADSKEGEDTIVIDPRNYLLLKGQMKHIIEIDCIVFLCSPM